jgi:hypothetical protein
MRATSHHPWFCRPNITKAVYFSRSLLNGLCEFWNFAHQFPLQQISCCVNSRRTTGDVLWTRLWTLDLQNMCALFDLHFYCRACSIGLFSCYVNYTKENFTTMCNGRKHNGLVFVRYNLWAVFSHFMTNSHLLLNVFIYTHLRGIDTISLTNWP